jgi:hypothetical protein
MRRTIILAILLSAPQPVLASSPDAWAQLNKQAERSCLVASGFRRPRVSRAIIFDDTVGVVAMLVTGTFTQARLKGAAGTNLCLYDRRTRKAVVEEAKGWSQRP